MKRVWCEVCKVKHPISAARGAVPGTCGNCKAETTDIHLITIPARVDGKVQMGLELLCGPCATRGVTIPLGEIFPGATQEQVELIGQ